jgi:hypothetical protein
MTVRYVGIGGSDAADGLSYANRKLTLNGVEDTPVVAGDLVYVAPGVYRELLTLDVSGTSGNPITYVADVSGANTDGIGGPVRITGSDNDQTTARNNCITGAARSYRTFRGFWFGFSTSTMIVTTGAASSNWIIEDCVFAPDNTQICVSFAGTGTGHIIRRCKVFNGMGAPAFNFTHTVTVDNAGHLVEGCDLHGGPAGTGVGTTRVGGITVKHCTIAGFASGVRVFTALTVGQTVTVNNCIIQACSVALNGTATTEIIEDYNSITACTTARTNTSTGSNSNTYPPIFAPPMLLSGVRYPWQAGDLSSYSQLRRIAGTSMSSDDLYGITRPATDSKKSWGAVQYNDTARETTTKRTGAASLKLADAGQHQMFIPVTAVSTTVSCYVYWEADYTGTKPQMILRQPGQSDITVTATGSAATWELLTHTWTPSANPGYVVALLTSSNTAAAGNFDTFFDDLAAS